MSLLLRILLCSLHKLYGMIVHKKKHCDNIHIPSWYWFENWLAFNNKGKLSPGFCSLFYFFPLHMDGYIWVYVKQWKRCRIKLDLENTFYITTFDTMNNLLKKI